jgi:hypothetical protein
VYGEGQPEASVIEQAPVQGWQQAPLGMQGLGVHDAMFGKTVPLHGMPVFSKKQLPARSQQTPCWTHGTRGEQGPGIVIQPVGQGVANCWQTPEAGSQQTVTWQGFGLQEERFGKVAPVQAVMLATRVQLPAASQQTICGQGLGVQEVRLGKRVPLHVAPAAMRKQLFWASQQTP